MEIKTKIKQRKTNLFLKTPTKPALTQHFGTKTPTRTCFSLDTQSIKTIKEQHTISKY